MARLQVRMTRSCATKGMGEFGKGEGGLGGGTGAVVLRGERN